MNCWTSMKVLTQGSCLACFHQANLMPGATSCTHRPDATLLLIITWCQNQILTVNDSFAL